MRKLLRWLRGEPQPIVITFSRDDIAHARPGDVLVLTSHVPLTPEIQAALAGDLIPKLHREAPGVALCINSPEWHAVVVPTGQAQ